MTELPGPAGGEPQNLPVDPILDPETPAAPPAGPPAKVLWPVLLFFQPRAFFERVVPGAAPMLVGAAYWIYGIAGSLDRLEKQRMKGKEIPFDDSWPIVWGFVLVVGGIGAVLYYLIGGWWYRVRLKWCGAGEPDPILSRRVYGFSSLVWAIPFVLYAMVGTFRYASPAEAALAEASWLDFALLAFPFWSLWTSHTGVRTLFWVRPVLALVWFLVLPAALYAAGIAIVVLAVASGPLQDAERPDLDHLKRHSSDRLFFEYPGNWRIESEDEDYDPNANIDFDCPQDATMNVLVYDSESTAEEELDEAIERFRNTFADVSAGSTFSTWGIYSGSGWEATGKYKAVTCRIRLFVARTQVGPILQVREVYRPGDERVLKPGFERIRRTLRVGSRAGDG
ncbi:MAG: hypothetical protein HY720_24920 [Planctomycetes bacterium]|nr:hypothetical protein [Planctomycetota bacterium]